jgi:hypothetical protein
LKVRLKLTTFVGSTFTHKYQTNLIKLAMSKHSILFAFFISDKKANKVERMPLARLSNLFSRKAVAYLSGGPFRFLLLW